jgi:hypothetical protein
MARATASISAATKFSVMGSPGLTLGGLGVGVLCAHEFDENMPLALIPIDMDAINNFLVRRVGRFMKVIQF